MLNTAKIREDFPILQRQVNGYPLVYLDNAATTQKPRQVIQSLVDYYETENANIHRGVHTLSQEATAHFEAAREKVAQLIQAPAPESIIFTRNTTESINLVASAWGLKNIKAGDEIVLNALEHHSNLIPWQLLAQKTGAVLKFIPITVEGTLDLSVLPTLLGDKTRMIAVNHMSNALGTIHDIATIAQAAKACGSLLLIDGAQSISHIKTDVQAMGCDFLAFSSHKMMGPTGVGVLYGRPELLEAMDPYQGGGDMIKEVWVDHAKWNDLPYKFEAGTPNIADVIALGAAIDYLNQIGLDRILEHEQMLLAYTLDKLKELDNVILYGPSDLSQRGGIVSFNLRDIHPHDVGSILDQCGVAIRAGHHCCQPIMRQYGISGTARASFYLYNTLDEVDTMLTALKKAQEVFYRVARR